ncbi:MAG: cyclic nucleotide-binding domain-containing protein [Gammaproteobacteria bacterium]|nr:cyclic nucleotide-binding domain-containing protein [Gammaproteobacteria bacterium]
MFDFDASIIVHIAALLYVVGFMIREQLVLRLVILAGSMCYLAYYYFAMNPPLWDAMAWTTITSLANSYIIVQLILDRTTWNMSPEMRDLYSVFDTMSPGEFRRLVAAASWETGVGTTEITREGAQVNDLYYVTEGPIKITKQNSSFELPGKSFIGEVAFFLDTKASATVELGETAKFLRWNKAELEKLQQKDPGIRAALHNILNKDMAAKVAQSMGDAAIA